MTQNNDGVKRVHVDDLFDEATGHLNWATIDQLYAAVEENPALVAMMLPPDIQKYALKDAIRKAIKRRQNEQGHAAYASVTRKDENGKQVRLYKNEGQFEVDDYEQVVDYHGGLAKHHYSEAKYYSTQCNNRYGIQPSFDYE